MVTLEIDIIEGATCSDLANDLREIANSIDNGYRGGLTCFCGTSWGIDGEEEEDEDIKKEEFSCILQRKGYSYELINAFINLDEVFDYQSSFEENYKEFIKYIES